MHLSMLETLYIFNLAISFVRQIVLYTIYSIDPDLLIT